jgi:hypothetical protein
VQLYDWRQVVARTDTVYRAVAGAEVRESNEVAR